MRLHFKGTNYEIPLDVQERATKKINVIAKFVETKEGDEAQVYFELGREVESHQHGRIWRAEIQVDQAGERTRAVRTEESLDSAIDRACKELEQELRKIKTKRVKLARKGGGMLKSMLRGFRS